MLTTDWPARGLPVRLVSAGLAISGLFDLVPLIHTSINDKLGMDQAEALAMSPIGMPTPYGARFVATLGGEESAEFEYYPKNWREPYLARAAHAGAPQPG